MSKYQLAPERRLSAVKRRLSSWVAFFGLAMPIALGITAPTIAHAADAEPVTLVLGDQAGLLRGLVEASGVLKDSPFAYRWANFQGAAPLYEAQHAGAVDIAWGGDLPILAASVGDPALKVITTLGGSPSSLGLLVHADSPIRTVADLKGHTVVVSSARGSVAQYQLYGALAAAGLKTSDVQIRFVLPTDASAAFESKQIDVWATFDPYFGVAQQHGARILKDGTGINSGLFFVTASGKAVADPAKRVAISAFLARLREAGTWAQAHTADYARVYANLTHVSPEAAQLIVNRSFIHIRPFTDADLATLQKVADTAAQDAILPTRVDVKAISDQTLAGQP